MDYGVIAERIQSLLGLEAPPVGLSLMRARPAGVRVACEAVPSSCALWRHAEEAVFYAAAEQHFNCPVGALVMGFRLPEAVQERLGSLIDMMCECGYLDPEEAASVPSMPTPSAGILYGPLAALPAVPDVVLLWLTPQQAMLYSEAVGTASWAQEPMSATGRPACAALPLAVQGGRPMLSLGCIGMRTFTQVADDRLLAAVPGGKLEKLVAGLERIVEANQAMQSFYERHQAEIARAGGQRRS